MSNDEDYACHLCGAVQCGCTAEDTAKWRGSVCPSCGGYRSKSMGCPDACVKDRSKASTRGPLEFRRLAENLPRIWNDDQVASLNAYQTAGVGHPFTCGHVDHSTELVAYPEGWRCPVTGEMEQDWAHGFMSDWSWEKMDWLGRTWDREKGKWK